MRKIIDYCSYFFYRLQHLYPSDEFLTLTKILQRSLTFQYKNLLKDNVEMLRTFEEVGLRVFSQGDEDGILLYIFSLIGTTNKKVVEICAGDGIECNSANLIINHGWVGLLFDGSDIHVKKGKNFYSRCKDTLIYPPTFVKAWITAENINSLIQAHGFEGEIDLLSIDMDGMDYWVWKVIDCIRPRVMICEYQDIWGYEKAVTVPYSPHFNRFAIHPDYCGASLGAWKRLGSAKGYRLIGCNRYGYNAFFMRSDVGENIFPEILTKECFKHPKVIDGMKNRLPQVMRYQWVEV